MVSQTASSIVMLRPPCHRTKKKVNHWLENRYVSFPLWVWKAWKTLRDVTKQNLKLKITVYVFVDNSVCRFLLGCSVTLIKTSTMVGREARDMKHKQNGTVKCTNVHLIKHHVRQYDRSPSFCSIITCDSFFTALFEKKKKSNLFSQCHLDTVEHSRTLTI